MLNSAVQFLIEMALRLGFAILPVGPDKRSLVAWKEYQLTAPSLQQVMTWEEQFNPAAWAIITGAISGVVVLDFDGERGNATMAALGLHPHVRTGSGGHHVYFVHRGWHVQTVNGKAKRELGVRFPGLDIRADGGYAIFAGRSSSGEYVWLRDMTPDPLQLLPDEVREALGLLVPPLPPPQDAFGDNGSSSSHARSVWSGRILELALHRVPDHGRNNAGFWLACQLRDNGYSSGEAETALSEYVTRVPVVNTKGAPEPYTTDEAMHSVRQAYAKSPREPWSGLSSATLGFHTSRNQLPTIESSNRELRDLSTESFAAVRAGNDPPYLFTRSGQMVHVVVDEKGRYSIREVTVDYIRGCLTRSANFRRVWLDRGGERHEIATSPPLDAVRDILVQPSTSWGLPPLESITGVPLIRPDGSVITTPGYDPATWVIYTPAPGFSISSIPDKPSDEEIERSVVLILTGMWGGFPFVDPASRANMLALLLTMILRRAIKGCVPIGLIYSRA
jgi:hypothetical protein